MTDVYQSIEKRSEGLYREKGSKFYAYACPVADEEEIKGALEDIKKEHPTARHICYAWLLGADQDKYRANDAGEPSGTAGLPILGQIRSNELSDVLVIVVRYFGGTKLGTPGLKNAYKTAAKEALSVATVKEKVLQTRFSVHFEYAGTSEVMAILNKLNAEITAQEFGSSCTIHFSVRRKESLKVHDIFDKMANLDLVQLNSP